MHCKTNSLDSQLLCSSLNRRINIRNSRSSLRSSTDDSVHSTSSNKSETDEESRERISPPLSRVPHIIVERVKDLHGIASSTEDESGFSSLNSFQEIGLPLVNSTMLSNGRSASSSASSNSDESTELGGMMDTTIENKNKTILNTVTKAIPIKSEFFMIQNHHQNYHRRWESAPVSPLTKKQGPTFSTFSNGDESLRVLWV